MVIMTQNFNSVALHHSVQKSLLFSVKSIINNFGFSGLLLVEH